MNPEARVERWREMAGIVAKECHGDLSGCLRARCRRPGRAPS